MCPGCDGTLSIITTNADTFQWQFFNGISWVDLTDSGIYSGTTTTTLSLTNPSPSNNANQYRVIAYNSLFKCSNDIFEVVIMTVNATRVIPNRRITYRVKKN